MMTDRINDSSSWRAFEDSELTHSAAHYLTAIHTLRHRYGYARVTDVADYLKISRGAASRAIALLKERGWIKEDPHRMLELTESGHELAQTVERNYLVLEWFLEHILGMPAEVAHEDACKMEHLLSPLTTGALFRLIRTLERNKPLLGQIKKQLENCQSICPEEGLDAICEQYGGCIAATNPPNQFAGDEKKGRNPWPQPQKQGAKKQES